MVRLKDHFLYIKKYRSTISIPYGAIKRFVEFACVHVYWRISIPYGAIKRVVKKVIGWLSDLFQFLMVRLKEFFTSVFIIPYFLFQFLMVRLKEKHLIDISIKKN